MNPEILINGRFLHRPLSGVERYACAVSRQLEGRARLVSPGLALNGFAGHLWEQYTLLKSLPPGSLLWSPANTGPLLARNQVATIHDLAPLDHPEWYRPAFAAWYRVLLPELARRARHIISPSEFSKRRLIERLGVPTEKVTVVPEGVDPAVFRPQSEQAIAAVLTRLRLDPPYLLAVGALPGRKNLERLLEAWKLVKSFNQKVTLVVVGSRQGVFRAGLGVAVPERVRWLGHLADSDLAALYSGALAFVYPSLYEGFGLCLLEAMACGTPVLCSAASALPEVATEAALLVDGKDKRALAAGLQRLIADAGLRADLRYRGLERAQAFTWERTTKMVWSVLVEAWEAGALSVVQAPAGWNG